MIDIAVRLWNAFLYDVYVIYDYKFIIVIITCVTSRVKMFLYIIC